MKFNLKNKNIYNIILAVVLIIISIFMFYWINQKEGFHEDEIFSYGSSNYMWDNVYQASGKSDAVNRTIEKYIISDSFYETVKNIQHYLLNQEEFSNLRGEIQKDDKPVWKTNDDAKDYVTINSTNDAINYFSVYYNQFRDIHPPLFYFVVHFISALFFGIFSKYIIFIINFIFIMATCFVIYKIFNIYNKKWLAIPTIILYGLSIGAASTAIFLRMYAMLTFFCLAYLYLNLKLLKNNFELKKKEKLELFFVILLGFLTQYYFCVFIALVFILMCIRLIYKKDFASLKKYLFVHIISAIVGIILYPASIHDIFFSYRGVGNGGSNYSLLESVSFYLKQIFEAYSINNIFIYSILILIIIIGIFSLINKIRKKEINKSTTFDVCLLTVPTLLYLIIIAKLSPAIEAKYAMRYVMAILPEIAIIFVLAIYCLFKNKKISYAFLAITITLVTINGFVTNTPRYLYKGYAEYLEIANKYKDLNFVYTCDNGFTHINSLPEFMIYNKSLIINVNYDDLSILENDEELLKQDKFILSIKKWTNVDNILNEVLLYTNCSNYTVLLDNNDDTQSIIYLIE